MARPMILIKPALMETLYKASEEGVPISYLIRKHKLSITSPTAAKLLSYYAKSQQASTSPEVKEIILKSLFPTWLLSSLRDTAVQDISTHKYTGKMPLGRWIIAS